MEAVDVAVAVAHDEEREAGVGERDEVTGLLEADRVREEDPFAREDGAALELVQAVGAVPGCGQAAGWWWWGFGVLLVTGRRPVLEEAPHLGSGRCAKLGTSEFGEALDRKGDGVQ